MYNIASPGCPLHPTHRADPDNAQVAPAPLGTSVGVHHFGQSTRLRARAHGARVRRPGAPHSDRHVRTERPPPRITARGYCTGHEEARVKEG